MVRHVRTAGRKMKITALSEENIAAAIALTQERLPEQSAELEAVGEAPATCMRMALAYASGDAQAKAQATQWGDSNGIDVRRLQYFVLQNDAGELLGVSGVYGTKPPYLERMGIEKSETTDRLQQPNQFWMAYTAVSTRTHEKGIGTKLMRHGMECAQQIAQAENIPNPQWALLADPGAITYYEQFGMKPVLTHGEELVFETPLATALAATVAKDERRQPAPQPSDWSKRVASSTGGEIGRGSPRTAPAPREGNWAAS